MKILRIAAENFKNLRIIDVRPNADITQISGGNGAGKTNVLDAFFYGLQARKTLPARLLRKGTKRGVLQIQLDGYTIFRELDEKGGSLRIETDNKTLIKDPVDWLEKVTGELGFDPLDFMQLKPEEQFTVLKGIVELEEDIDELEAHTAADEETKLRIRANRRDIKRTLETIQVVEELPAQTYDINALMEELKQADEFNRDIEAKRRTRAELEKNQEYKTQRITQQEKALEELRAEILGRERELAEAIQKRDEQKAEMDKWKPLEKPRDRSAIDTRIREASATNNAIISNTASRTRRDELKASVDSIDKQDEELEDAIRRRKLRIGEVMAKAKFPVPGLSFETVEEGSGGRERKNPKKVVTYNGIPLADASSAEQIRVSVAIGMATNPDVKMLLIRDGSLIDNKGMAILKQMARENEFQYILEVVDTSGKVGIYLEDGTVKAVNAEDPDAPAPRTRSRKKENSSK